MLFQDDGVWQLLAGQDGAPLGQRSLGAQLEALPLFDVEHLYVDRHDLRTRGLDEHDLLLPVTALDTPDLAGLIEKKKAPVPRSLADRPVELVAMFLLIKEARIVDKVLTGCSIDSYLC